MRALLAALALALALPASGETRELKLPDGRVLAYAVEPDGPAAAQARRVVQLLADGDVESAARLSNAPEDRLAVLSDFRSRVGEDQFRALFARYLDPRNRVAAEIVLGTRRLVVWELGEADQHLAGQFFVEQDGAMLMDDRPGPERADLRRILQAWRRDARPSVRKD